MIGKLVGGTGTSKEVIGDIDIDRLSSWLALVFLPPARRLQSRR
jgi:hypothetical protein